MRSSAGKIQIGGPRMPAKEPRLYLKTLEGSRGFMEGNGMTIFQSPPFDIWMVRRGVRVGGDGVRGERKMMSVGVELPVTAWSGDKNLKAS